MMSSVMPCRTALLCTLAAAFAAPTARAQNMLSNGAFDTDISGWQAGFASASAPEWSPDDCCGSAGSGSARLLVGGLSAYFVSECIVVAPSTSYDFAFRMRALQNSILFFTGAGGSIDWYSSSACEALESSSSGGLFVSTPVDWSEFGATFVSPPTAQAARVVLGGSGALSSGVDAYFDNVRFGLPGTVPVTLQAFSVD